jgi:hypothetical protein
MVPLLGAIGPHTPRVIPLVSKTPESFPPLAGGVDAERTAWRDLQRSAWTVAGKELHDDRGGEEAGDAARDSPRACRNVVVAGSAT